MTDIVFLGVVGLMGAAYRVQLGGFFKSPIPLSWFLAQIIVVEEVLNEFFPDDLLHHHSHQLSSGDPPFLCDGL